MAGRIEDIQHMWDQAGRGLLDPWMSDTFTQSQNRHMGPTLRSTQAQHSLETVARGWRTWELEHPTPRAYELQREILIEMELRTVLGGGVMTPDGWHWLAQYAQQRTNDPQWRTSQRRGALRYWLPKALISLGILTILVLAGVIYMQSGRSGLAGVFLALAAVNAIATWYRLRDDWASAKRTWGSGTRACTIARDMCERLPSPVPHAHDEGSTAAR